MRGDFMKTKYIFPKDIKEMKPSELEKSIDKSPIDSKKKVLSYLKSFPECAYTSAPVFDAFNSKKVYDADNARTDGKYTWYESEIYHFEKYNLKLNEDFIQHVLNRP